MRARDFFQFDLDFDWSKPRSTRSTPDHATAGIEILDVLNSSTWTWTCKKKIVQMMCDQILWKCFLTILEDLDALSPHPQPSSTLLYNPNIHMNHNCRCPSKRMYMNQLNVFWSVFFCVRSIIRPQHNLQMCRLYYYVASLLNKLMCWALVFYFFC